MGSDSKHIITALQRLAMFWRASQWLVAKDFALNPTQGEVLTRVAAKPERAVDLADMLGISQASLSDSVAALDRKGLVRRRRDPDDGRARMIEVTRAGASLAERMPDAPAVIQEAIAGLAEDDRAGLLRCLSLIIRSLQEAEAIPIQRMCLTCHYFRPHVHTDPVRPHHCGFVDAAFGDGGLRLDCADHETATEEEAARNRTRLSAVG
ncbi:MarR family winged helix-turn-helix transcriptional regulator [Celeribacter baekdonensis]|jgi:DNA-binding MarR family transcriptional regulator|uniref:MarR family transcriptional regulator n=1 Tax=Celeribacter baekdonensis B30 TaxID=1208323 RepID=K2JCA3_9RHOB|nr:MarR family winged helix-turn-helix transcriptional regulator [Celeribacter baekdonensis]EKE68214.1 MarR family transcriptional regulator [Celeribacter baekdonensis B30]